MKISSRTNRQVLAITWAQWRMLINFLGRSKAGFEVLSWIFSALWYAGFVLLAILIGYIIASVRTPEMMVRYVPFGMAFAFLYWQVVPLLLASAGASLDLKRLLVYPIPNRRLFLLEVSLRFSNAPEVVIILCGAAVGLWSNPVMPAWGPLFFVPFVLFNLFVAAGIRDLFGRLLARKHVREVLVLGLVMLAALPQVLMVAGGDQLKKIGGITLNLPRIPWPWTVMGELAAGRFTGENLIFTALWTIVAYSFGRNQFERNLRFDSSAVRSTEEAQAPRWLEFTEWLYRVPSALLPDPLGILVEKEIRFLSRAPRFRLLFIMGFTFGIVILLPLAYGRHGAGLLADNYLTAVCAYSILLLSEVAFWNCFGFDRSAAQFYFVAPVSFAQVLIGKNIAAAFFVALEIALVTGVCALARLPVTLPRILEAVSVATLMTIYVLAIGNLASTSHPRGVDPADSWRRSGAGKFQLVLLLVYPIISLPAGLAYLARYAFNAEWAFYSVVAFGIGVGLILYWVALGSAVETSQRKRDQLLEALSEGHGLVG